MQNLHKTEDCGFLEMQAVEHSGAAGDVQKD